MTERERARPLDWKAPDYTAVYLERAARLRKVKAGGSWDALVRYYQVADPAEFVEDWLFTYDPRLVAHGRDPFSPFVLFPRQREFIAWLHARFSGRSHGLVEKSRDMGVSWLCCAYALWLWLFRPGVVIGFGSQSLDDVDTLGVPKSLLQKVRLMLDRLPLELRPIGYLEERHARYMRIRNPETGALITGDGGEEIGRGDRTSLYFVDEAAHLEQAERVDAALSATTDVRIDVSTPNGQGNSFYRKRFGGNVEVFTFHWTADPRKDQAWYDKMLRDHGPEVVAREVDLDYGSSGGDVVVESKWVLGSQQLRAHLERSGELRSWRSKREPSRVAGLDVGGGVAPSVFVVRDGPVVEPTSQWLDGDTMNTAGRAADLVRLERAEILKFDSVGVGRGVAAALIRIQDVASLPINMGERPTNQTWPDGKTSRQKFVNARAESWWKVRERMRKTYEHWLHVQGKGGQEHPLEALLLLPDDPKLCGQLSLPRYSYTETGKIAVERKVQMKARGVRSPDHADALVLTFAPQPRRVRAGRMKGLS